MALQLVIHYTYMGCMFLLWKILQLAFIVVILKCILPFNLLVGPRLSGPNATNSISI